MKARFYLKLMKPPYVKADRSEQSRLLGEMEQVSGLHRKSLLRLLHALDVGEKEAEQGAGADVWAGGGASDPGGAGKPGLCLCRTTHPSVAFDS